MRAHFAIGSGAAGDGLQALRRLGRARGFSAAAILTLALGIGAATAIFSVVYAVLLRPLPFSEPGRLAAIESRTPFYSSGVTWSSDHDFLAWRRRSTAFSSLAGYESDSAAFSRPGGPGYAQEINGAKISGGFLRTLGVRPIMGHGFTPAEHAKGAAPVVLISYRLWRRLGWRNVLGHGIRLDGVARRIVGVMPAGFDFPGMEAGLGGPEKDDYWLPYAFHPGPAGLWWRLGVVGRRRPGFTMAQAEVQLRAISAAADRSHKGSGSGFPFGFSPPLVMPLRAEVLGAAGNPLWLLLAASGLLLLIACANMANLLLARAANREREFAICAALGAGRKRLARQIVTEGVALALAGAAGGVALAWVALMALKAAMPADIPRIGQAGVNGWALAFACAVAIAAGVLASLAPVFSLARGEFTQTLKTGPREGGDRRGRRLRQGLVVAEIGLAVVLAIGSGLFFRSLMALNGVNPGYSARQVVVIQPSPPASYSPQQVRAYDLRLVRQVRSQPGVASAALTQVAPMTRSFSITTIALPGRKLGSHPPTGDNLAVGPGFFATMRLPLLQGRHFTAADSAAKARDVAIIDTVMAQEFWPGRNPIGQKFNAYTVIGVAPHIQIGSLGGKYGAEFYVPATKIEQQGGDAVVARTAISAAALAPELLSAARRADPAVPIALHTLRMLIHRSEAAPRFRTILVGLFAGLALALAAIGIYGVMAYAVERRRREMGVRAALGAGRGRLLAMVMGEALRLAAVGAAAGSLAAWLLARTLRGFLFRTPPTDPVSFAAAVAVLVAAALGGALVPAIRAARLDPAKALRAE
ncbi:MAG: ADOP family duplicated permease [Terriglobales bacterium]